MIYIGAVEDAGIFLGPVHVYRMTDTQAANTTDKARVDYRSRATARRSTIRGHRWYRDNTREPIRDETLREGLIQVGAVLSRQDIPTTSGKGRYYLQRQFAALFDPGLRGAGLQSAIETWQRGNLSKSALTRISLANRTAHHKKGSVQVNFPDRTTRNLTAGPSAEISKAVIEVFAKKFLADPVVIWLSASDDKVVTVDDKVAASIGLNIKKDKDLPDIILADLAPKNPMLIFVEVVATDGPISERRQTAIYALTDLANFSRAQIAFVTAYQDRNSAGFRKTISNLAWNSFAWFMTEPDKIVHLKNGTTLISILMELE
jgi:hypothetical protein